jgi:hypothetical protein
VSVDSLESHRKWAEELGGVNYPLLSDDGKTVSRLYGVLDEKEGVCLRGTFIINPTGEITYLVISHTKGLAPEQSYNIVKVLLRQEHAFLRTFQEKVFGLGSAEINRPLQGALVMALSFIVGASVPIVPYLLIAGRTALYLSIVLSGLAFFGVGFV